MKKQVSGKINFTLVSFRFLGTLTALTVSIFTLAVNCGSSHAQLVRASDDVKPAWINNIPDPTPEYAYFVGTSNDYVSEKESRNDALRDARTKVVQYLQTSVESVYEEIKTTSGNISGILDPRLESAEFNRQVSAGVAAKVAEKSTYYEVYRKFTKVQVAEIFRVWVLARVDVNGINDVYKTAVQRQIDSVKEKIKNAKKDEKAALEKTAALLDEKKRTGITF